MLSQDRPRISWIDIAKGYGILLVFFGHFGEELMPFGAPLSGEIFKAIYSFHMPFFFVLAGYMWKPRQSAPLPFVANRLRKRIVPYLALNLLIIPAWLLRDLLTGSFAQMNYPHRLELFAKGQVAFNVPTWFLVCLFMVDLIHYLWGPLTRRWPVLLASAAVFLAGGLWVTRNIFAVSKATFIPPDFWYLHEGLVGYGLFLVGLAVRRSGLLDRSWPRPAWAGIAAGVSAAGLGAVGLGAAVGLTYSLNNGPFIFTKQVVHMATSSHGNSLWFTVTAVAGSLGVLALAQATASRGLEFVGRYSLAYIGFAGLFLQFFNPLIAKPLQGALPLSPAVTVALSLAVTLASVLVCAPLARPLEALLARISGAGERRNQKNAATPSGNTPVQTGP